MIGNDHQEIFNAKASLGSAVSGAGAGLAVADRRGLFSFSSGNGVDNVELDLTTQAVTVN